MRPRSLGAMPLGAPVATKLPFVEARHVSAPQVGITKDLEATLAGSDQTAGTAAAMAVMNMVVFMLMVMISVEWWFVAMNRLTTCTPGRPADRGVKYSQIWSISSSRVRFPADGQTVAIGRYFRRRLRMQMWVHRRTKKNQSVVFRERTVVHRSGS